MIFFSSEKLFFPACPTFSRFFFPSGRRGSFPFSLHRLPPLPSSFPNRAFSLNSSVLLLPIDKLSPLGLFFFLERFSRFYDIYSPSDPLFFFLPPRSYYGPRSFLLVQILILVLGFPTVSLSVLEKSFFSYTFPFRFPL